MKKIIKWLADKSGVTTETKIKQTKHIGNQMKDYSYWLTQYPDGYNALGIYADMLTRGLPYPYAHMADRIRDKYIRNQGEKYDNKSKQVNNLN